jgi:type I restriction enzyme S subunit
VSDSHYLSIPCSWLQVELGELITANYGKALATVNRTEAGHVPVIGSSGIVGYHDQALVEGACLVIGRKGAAGSVHFVSNSSWPIDTAYFIQPPHGININYLCYLLSSCRLESLDKSTAIPSLSRDDLYRVVVPLAPTAEQARITEKTGSLLSDLDTAVAELKSAQKKLAQYRQSLLKTAVEGTLTAQWRTQNTPTETGAQLLQRILIERRTRWEAKQREKFKEQGNTPPKDWKKKYPEPVQPDIKDLPELPEGWVWASIEQIVSTDKYSLAIGPFGSNLKVPDYRETGTPLVFVRNIRQGNYGGTHTKYVTPEKAQELAAHSVDAGDVLITKMGEPPGDADVYPADQPRAIITADCIKVRCWQKLMRPDFLKTIINSYIGQKQIKPITQGVAQKKVSLGRFAGLAVPIPSMDEQNEIMAVLSTANNEAVGQEAAVALTLTQSAAQRQNILRAAFSGQLVPQDPTDEPASKLLERIRAERAKNLTKNKHNSIIRSRINKAEKPL